MNCGVNNFEFDILLRIGTYLSNIFLSLAKASKFAIGSEPADRRKINGVVGTLSLNDASRSKVGGSTYDCPILLTIKFCELRKNCILL